MTQSTQHHSDTGTNYGGSVRKYANHGRDGALFLDPHFLRFITGKEVEGKKVVDIGCGRAHWAIHAAREGAYVTAFDYQKGMVDAASDAIAEEEEDVRDHIFLFEGDANNVNVLQSKQFDTALSVNVGCNLPVLDDHLGEMFRLLKKGGTGQIGK